MAPLRIKGAIGIAGRVYRAGQEVELEAAAARAEIDLSRPRFATALEGGEPVVVARAKTVASGTSAETDVVFTAAKPKVPVKAPAKAKAPPKKGKAK